MAADYSPLRRRLATAMGARVTRTVELGIPGRLAFLRSVVVARYARESERLLEALKAAAEG